MGRQIGSCEGLDDHRQDLKRKERMLVMGSSHSILAYMSCNGEWPVIGWLLLLKRVWSVRIK